MPFTALPETVFGLMSLIILTLCGVVRRQYQDNQALQKKYDDIQELRRLDAKEMTDKATVPLESISQTLNLVYDKLKASKEA